MTIIMAYSTRRFYDANPKLAGAVVAALDEAARYIAANKLEAVRIYTELASVKAKEEDLMRMLNDPDTHYSASPEGVMKYAEFLHRIGTIRNKPQAWKDLFFPPVHDKTGS
jgi:sulfonate transport system substrate-binding protein